MDKKIEIKTGRRTDLIDITSQVQKAVSESDIKDGNVVVFVPHTTAGITINENADPSVRKDILAAIDKLIPLDDPAYEHSEGNSAAHIKASLVGSSVSVFISGGKLKLGTWQGIYFCEFDGPRRREVLIKIR